MNDLTPRQRQVWQLLQDRRDPTLRDMAAELGVSVVRVHTILVGLYRKGYVQRRNQYRGRWHAVNPDQERL